MNQDEILKCPQIGNAFLSGRFNAGFGELRQGTFLSTRTSSENWYD